jgi:hypothetical protein
MNSVAGWNFVSWTVCFFFSLGLLFAVFTPEVQRYIPDWFGFAVMPFVLLTLLGWGQSGMDLYHDVTIERSARRGRYRL